MTTNPNSLRPHTREGGPAGMLEELLHEANLVAPAQLGSPLIAQDFAFFALLETSMGQSLLNEQSDALLAPVLAAEFQQACNEGNRAFCILILHLLYQYKYI